MNKFFASLAVVGALLVAPGVISAQKTTWVALLLVYRAPDDAIDWHGPWTRGMTINGKNFYPTEADCKADTDGWIARIHKGMRAPILYRCVPFQESLP